MCLNTQIPAPTLSPQTSFLELAQDLPDTGTSHPTLCSSTIISGSWYLDPEPDQWDWRERQGHERENSTGRDHQPQPAFLPQPK